VAYNFLLTALSVYLITSVSDICRSPSPPIPSLLPHLVCVSRALRKIYRFCELEINLELIFNSIFGVNLLVRCVCVCIYLLLLLLLMYNGRRMAHSKSEISTPVSLLFKLKEKKK